MVDFDKVVLDNGLRLIIHPDPSTPIVAVNILYDVGSRDENPDRTGFAHLFEHLMFGGSANIPKYDTPLERAGGENNAFTNNDITNYYLTIPKQNLELALWLESDRMLDLAFSPESLKVQRNVVIEEFKQGYLNQPYGDVWLLLRPLAYKVHPYRWPTIGMDISHIENARMEDVVGFYQKHYHPSNAIMAIAGDVDPEEIVRLVEKWFGGIKPGKRPERNLATEPVQREHRKLSVSRNVPFDALYKVFHMCNRFDAKYHTTDLLSDILSNGDSSRLHTRLVKKKRLFSSLDAYITGDLDEGLFVFSGKLVKGTKMKDAEEALNEEIRAIAAERPGERELEKVQNKIESSFEFSQMNVLNKAMNLAFYEHLGEASLLNEEVGKYRSVRPDDVRETASEIFRAENCSSLYYHSN